MDDDYSIFGYTSDEGPWYGGAINRGIDVLGAWASRSPYYSPDDPRYQQQQQQRQPQVYAPTDPNASGAVRTNLNNDGAGINLSKETLMLIAGGVLIFMVASKRR